MNHFFYCIVVKWKFSLFSVKKQNIASFPPIKQYKVLQISVTSYKHWPYLISRKGKWVRGRVKRILLVEAWWITCNFYPVEEKKKKAIATDALQHLPINIKKTRLHQIDSWMHPPCNTFLYCDFCHHDTS